MSGRGACPVCDREFVLRADGRLRRHGGLSERHCSGGEGLPVEPRPEDLHVAALSEKTSEWLRIAASSLGLTLSEATEYAVCQWLHLALPDAHPLAQEIP